jgi:hypothetical protein
VPAARLLAKRIEQKSPGQGIADQDNRGQQRAARKDLNDVADDKLNRVGRYDESTDNENKRTN